MASVPVKELVELRGTKIAHDDFVEALKKLRERAFAVIRTHGADADYTKGYWRAFEDITAITASKPVPRQKDDDLPW